VRIHPEVGLGTILDELGRIGNVLGREARGLLAGRRAWAGGLTAAWIAVRRGQGGWIENLGRVTAHALRRGGDVDDTLRRVAGRKGGVGLGALRRRRRGRGSRCGRQRSTDRSDHCCESIHALPPHWSAVQAWSTTFQAALP